MGLVKVTATEFQQNIGRYQDTAQRVPVEISKNGRPYAVMMSAAFFEILIKGRVARKIEDVDNDTLEAILRSTVSSEHGMPDSILKDWTP